MFQRERRHEGEGIPLTWNVGTVEFGEMPTKSLQAQATRSRASNARLKCMIAL